MIDPTELRILVVDDNEFARANACAILRQIGMRHIHEASAGSEAYALLNDQPFDILLTDWYMPEISGAGLLAILRDKRIACRNQAIPVIVMTAYASSENLKKAQQLGTNDYLVKPLDQKSLSASLLKVMSAKEDDDAIEDDGFDLEAFSDPQEVYKL